MTDTAKRRRRVYQNLLVLPAMLLALTSCWGLDREVVISAYQGPCRDGDFSANLATTRQVIQEALNRKSDFLVLPETFLSGYDSPEHMRQGARRLDDPELQKFVTESSGHSMVILVGLARVTERGIFNTVLVIQQGKLLGTYDKMMLTEGDRDERKFLPGTAMPIFTANGARFGVIICHDSSFPFPAMLARLQGAELLFSPHYNSIPPKTVDAHRRWVRNCHIGLACQMKMVVARSNVVVVGNPKEVGYGDSFILSPQGEVLAGAELFKTELITARISPALFKYPTVWADLDETPAELKVSLAKILEGSAQSTERK